MLVTVTSRVRVHRDEVLCSLVRGNMLVLRFASMKPMRLPIDDLTEEARHWLLPSEAPREIPMDLGQSVDVEADWQEEQVEQRQDAR